MSLETEHTEDDTPFTEADKLDSLTKQDGMEVEKEVRPEVESVIEVLKSVEAALGAGACARLVESNIVLTLAGERGQTEYFGDSLEAGETDAKLLNPILEAAGIRLSALPSQGGRLLMNIDSLEGYERVSKNSRIPGIEPFDKSGGWEGLQNWVTTSSKGVNEACLDRRIVTHGTPDNIFAGAIKGYPDRAVIGIFSIPDTYENMGLFNKARIAHADAYDAAQPIYTFLKDDANSPDIIEHQQRWSEILEQFYESDYHKRLAAQPEFIAARSKLA